jgi:hypothetical protein
MVQTARETNKEQEASPEVPLAHRHSTMQESNAWSKHRSQLRRAPSATLHEETAILRVLEDVQEACIAILAAKTQWRLTTQLN